MPRRPHQLLDAAQPFERKPHDRGAHVHAATPVTGFREGDLIGHEVVSRLGLGNFPNGDPAATAMEWGVRQLNVDCTFRPAGVGEDQPVTADFFPAYDDDGGLLVAVTLRLAVDDED